MSTHRPGGRPSGADRNAVRVYHRCGGCGKKQEFVNSGKFRVNANGNSLDVWLIDTILKVGKIFNVPVDVITR